MAKKKSSSISRLSSNIKSISSYSVPEIDCSIKLDGNESPFELPKNLLKKVESVIKKIELNRYPNSNCINLLEKIEEDIDFPKDGILLGNGSDELIQILITTFTGKTGIVLVPTPTFSMYRLTSIALGKTVEEVDLNSSFDLDIEKIKDVLNKKDPDIIFLASPNNPTGNSFSKSKIIEILESTDAVVVVDEAYYDYFGESFIPLINIYENLMVLRTMSKIGFAALRLGFLVSNPTLTHELNKVRLPYNISTISQEIALIAFENYFRFEENFNTIKSERDKVFNALIELSDVEVYPSDANFFLIRVSDAEDIFKKLVDRNILVRNLSKPGKLENCLRVTIGTPEENQIFIKNLSEILSS